jgi:hypothetical protein
VTREERRKLRKAIALIVNDDGEGGWEEGVHILMRLAGYKVEKIDTEPGVDAFRAVAEKHLACHTGKRRR